MSMTVAGNTPVVEQPVHIIVPVLTKELSRGVHEVFTSRQALGASVASRSRRASWMQLP